MIFFPKLISPSFPHLDPFPTFQLLPPEILRSPLTLSHLTSNIIWNPIDSSKYIQSPILLTTSTTVPFSDPLAWPIAITSGNSSFILYLLPDIHISFNKAGSAPFKMQVRSHVFISQYPIIDFISLRVKAKVFTTVKNVCVTHPPSCLPVLLLGHHILILFCSSTSLQIYWLSWYCLNFPGMFLLSCPYTGFSFSLKCPFLSICI